MKCKRIIQNLGNNTGSGKYLITCACSLNIKERVE